MKLIRPLLAPKDEKVAAPPKPPLAAKAPETAAPEVKVDDENDEEDDGDDLPDDPAELQAMLKRARARLRRAEKKAADAGLTKVEEKRLTSEIALLAASVEAMKAKLDALVTDEEVEEIEEEQAAAIVEAKEEGSSWRMTLLG